MKLKRERGFPRFLTDTVLSINKGRDAAREHHAMKVRITSISSLDVLNTRARKQKKTSTIMKLQHCDLLLATKFRPRRFAAEWPSSVSRPSLMMSKLWLMLRRPPVVAGPHLPSASTCLQSTTGQKVFVLNQLYPASGTEGYTCATWEAYSAERACSRSPTRELPRRTPRDTYPRFWEAS